MDEPANTLSAPTHWHFGPGWPGRRCGAKTRRATACLKPALIGKSRCQPHGGKTTGVKGAHNGNYRHGRYTKESIANRRAANVRVRGLIREAKALSLVY
jgi:hypothetical protein